ncbi:MAG: polysaccharide deacetylase family protein [Acidimicrobiaceae bacterium]|nr:polysaccharide deacetylase family protein [Acidimicrobiaceae bacterium]
MDPQVDRGEKLAKNPWLASGTLAGIALVGHALPAITAIAPLRRRFFRQLSGLSDSPAIALTFDDGPDIRSTPLFLDCLDRLGWKATFFMLGSMAAKDPGLTREVQLRGHEVALHGYHHKNLLWRSPKATKDDMHRSHETLSEITGRSPRFYRPPYGVLNTQALITAKTLALTPVLWTAWGQDWTAKATPETVMGNLSNGLAPGATLLLHDSDCTSASDAYHSALGALDLINDRLSKIAVSIERLCDHFQS